MDIIGFVTGNFWNIILFVFVISSFLLKNYMRAKVEEGFNTDGDLFTQDKDLACHTLNINIKNHESLIKDYKERDAVTSLQYATELFEGFSSKFKELDCATHLLTMPPYKPKNQIEIPEKYRILAEKNGIKI